MKRKTLFLRASSAPSAAWPGCGDHRFCDLAGNHCCTAALDGLLPATLLLKSLSQLLATLADEKGREMSVKKEKRFLDRRDLSLSLSLSLNACQYWRMFLSDYKHTDIVKQNYSTAPQSATLFEKDT